MNKENRKQMRDDKSKHVNSDTQGSQYALQSSHNQFLHE